jgi:hypothetical protein
MLCYAASWGAYASLHLLALTSPQVGIEGRNELVMHIRRQPSAQVSIEGDVILHIR